MSDMKLILENWNRYLKEAESPPGCEPAKAAQDAAPSAGVSDGSFEQTIRTISRKDNARLKAFLRIAEVIGFSPKALAAMAGRLGVREPALLGNLPRVRELPDGIQKLVQSAASRPHIATFIRDEVKRLFKIYMKNPQAIVSTT